MTDRDTLRDRLDAVEAATDTGRDLEPFRVVFRDPETGVVSTVIDTSDDPEPGVGGSI